MPNIACRHQLKHTKPDPPLPQGLNLGSEFQVCSFKAQSRNQQRRRNSLAGLTTPSDGRRLEFSKQARLAIPKAVVEEIGWVVWVGCHPATIAFPHMSPAPCTSPPPTPPRPKQHTAKHNRPHPHQNRRSRRSGIDVELYRLAQSLLAQKRALLGQANLLKKLPGLKESQAAAAAAMAAAAKRRDAAASAAGAGGVAGGPVGGGARAVGQTQQQQQHRRTGGGGSDFFQRPADRSGGWFGAGSGAVDGWAKCAVLVFPVVVASDSPSSHPRTSNSQRRRALMGEEDEL